MSAFDPDSLSPSDSVDPRTAEIPAATERSGPLGRRTWITLLLIFVASAGLRLWLVDVVKDQERMGDQVQYLTGSRAHFRTGTIEYTFEGWDEAHSSPVYPYALAYARRIVPVDDFRPAVLSVQVVISCLSILLAFIIARRCFGRRNALWSAALVAFLPSFTAYSLLFLTETLYTFLFLAVAAILVSAKGRVSAKRAFAAGLVGGVAALTKSQFIVLSPLVILWLIARELRGSSIAGSKKAALLTASGYVFGLVLVVAPWSLHNTLKYDHFLMVDSNPGNVLYKNWNAFPPENHDVGLFKTWKAEAGQLESAVPIRPRSTEENIAARNSAEVKAAIAYVLAHPGHFLAQCWERTLALFNPTSFLIRRIRKDKAPYLSPGPAEFIVWLTLLSLSAILVFSVIGMTTVKPSIESLLPLLLLLGCAVLCVAILSTSRYRFPMLPFLGMYAVAGVQRLPSLLRKPSPGLALAIPILLVMALAFYRYVPLSL